MASVEDLIKITNSYKGAKEGGKLHSEILSIYNNHKPLARGYKVKADDAWCMTFISSCFIKAGAVSALGITECGCQEYVNYAKKHGMVVDEPQKGDLVFYDWQNNGTIDHVGFIYLVSGNNIFVTEGNKNDMVETRIISRYAVTVKCFVRPRYDSNSVSSYDMSKISFADSFDRNIAGKYECTASDFLALRYNPYITDDNLIDKIKSGDTCQNYGYFTKDWLLVVYNGKTGFANKTHLRKKV